jgi:hypothetical protein
VPVDAQGVHFHGMPDHPLQERFRHILFYDADERMAQLVEADRVLQLLPVLRPPLVEMVGIQALTVSSGNSHGDTTPSDLSMVIDLR